MKTTTNYVSLIDASIREDRRLNCKKYYQKNKDKMQLNYYIKTIGKETVDEYIAKFGEEAKSKLKILKKSLKNADVVI